MKRYSEEEKDTICHLYKKGLNCAEIGKKFTRCKESIRALLLSRNIKIRPDRYKKYSIDDNFFHRITTPEQAYALGWIVADGHISKKNTLCLRIQESDKVVLNTISKFLKNTSPLKFINYSKKGWKNQWSLNIHNKKICDALRDLGYREDKSYSAPFPNLSKQLYSHFIRGLFEGDGCISIAKRVQCHITGTKDICQKLYCLLLNKDIASHIYQTKRGYWYCVLNRSAIKKFLQWIYANCEGMFLPRKYILYKKL